MNTLINKSDINILKEYELEDYFEILPIYSNTNKSNCIIRAALSASLPLKP